MSPPFCSGRAINLKGPIKLDSLTRLFSCLWIPYRAVTGKIHMGRY